MDYEKSQELINPKPWPPAGIKWFYSDKRTAIACGDCREILPDLPKVDLVLTSPPYDNLRDYGGYVFDFEDTAKKLYQVVKVGGVVVWVVGDATIDGSETGTSFEQALFFKSIGFNLHDTMIYHKYSPPLTHNRYEQHFEYMFVFSKRKPVTFNPLLDKKTWEDKRTTKAIRRERDGSSDLGFASNKVDKIRGNVWHYNIGGGHVTKDKIAYNHPAIFPEQLADDHIVSWSNENKIVLDPFMGSGTTMKESKKLNRKSIGIEIEERYCEISANRCSQSVMELKC